MRFSNKVVLVTGGSGGLGIGFARRFADEGARVVLGDVHFEDMDEKLALIAGRSMIDTEILDVCSESDWRRLMERIVQEHGGLDILVNNAGVISSEPTSFENYNFQEWRRILGVNLDGLFLGIRTVVPAMRGRTAPSIVNIGSIAGLMGSHDHGAYGTSKGAVRALSRHAALSLAGECGIRVNTVHPGITWTSMTAVKFSRSHADEAEAKAHYAEQMPLKRVLEPADIAAAVAFLASDDAKMITGAELVVDGGFTLKYLPDRR